MADPLSSVSAMLVPEAGSMADQAGLCQAAARSQAMQKASSEKAEDKDLKNKKKMQKN